MFKPDFSFLSVQKQFFTFNNNNKKVQSKSHNFAKIKVMLVSFNFDFFSRERIWPVIPGRRRSLVEPWAIFESIQVIYFEFFPVDSVHRWVLPLRSRRCAGWHGQCIDSPLSCINFRNIRCLRMTLNFLCSSLPFYPNISAFQPTLDCFYSGTVSQQHKHIDLNHQKSLNLRLICHQQRSSSMLLSVHRFLNISTWILSLWRSQPTFFPSVGHPTAALWTLFSSAEFDPTFSIQPNADKIYPSYRTMWKSTRFQLEQHCIYSEAPSPNRPTEMRKTKIQWTNVWIAFNIN